MRTERFEAAVGAGLVVVHLLAHLLAYSLVCVVGCVPAPDEKIAECVNHPRPRVTYLVRPDAAEPSQPPALEWSDTCERLYFDPARDRVRRVRERFTKTDRREMRDWLGRVAREFEPREHANLARFLRALALRESSYNASAVHVLSPDLKAAEKAAQRLSEGGYPFADARVPIWTQEESPRMLTNAVEGEPLRVSGFAPMYIAWTENAWGFTRGLFGQPSALWLRPGGRWGEDLPPWALCDRRVATTLLVWAARDFLRECGERGFEPSWRTLNRRISSGHCRTRAAKYERQFTTRARAQGLDPDAPVSFEGRAWPEKSASRRELLERLAGL